MSALEIVSGIVLIISCLIIILLVMLQESKGNGLAGAIGGGEMLDAANRTTSRDAVLAKFTKIAAVVFFIITLVVSLFSIYFK